MTDVDGHEYIDYLLGLGPDDPRPPPPGGHPGGHGRRQRRWAPASACPTSSRSRRPARSSRPCRASRLVRFTNSGSEAVGTAVRLARAHTGRRLLVRFEGHYHGWQDVVYWSNHVDPDAAGPADHAAPGRVRPRRPGRARRHADRAHAGTTPTASSAADGRARRRDRRGDHRARRVQHRLHPARARLPRAAARTRPASTARCSSSTRSSPASASAAAAPRSGSASCPT